MQETDWDAINLAMLNEVQPGPGAGASSSKTGGGDFNILDHEPYFVRQDLLYIQAIHVLWGTSLLGPSPCKKTHLMDLC